MSLARAIAQHRFAGRTDLKTPVFVSFSTVVGSRGSTDRARDARGFAVKF